jgi:hypothetical protein
VLLSHLETVKELMGKYASPGRVAVDSDEREAIQRLNLHSFPNCKGCAESFSKFSSVWFTTNVTTSCSNLMLLHCTCS